VKKEPSSVYGFHRNGWAECFPPIFVSLFPQCKTLEHERSQLNVERTARPPILNLLLICHPSQPLGLHISCLFTFFFTHFRPLIFEQSNSRELLHHFTVRRKHLASAGWSDQCSRISGWHLRMAAVGGRPLVLAEQPNSLPVSQRALANTNGVHASPRWSRRGSVETFV
jgi:hypothetical protein